MNIMISKNGDVKALAKVKDLLASLEDAFPGQITVQDVISIETSNKTIYQLLASYANQVKIPPKDLKECPQCHRMVEFLAAQGICKPCLMHNAHQRAKEKREDELVDIDHPLNAVKVG